MSNRPSHPDVDLYYDDPRGHIAAELEELDELEDGQANLVMDATEAPETDPAESYHQQLAAWYQENGVSEQVSHDLATAVGVLADAADQKSAAKALTGLSIIHGAEEALEQQGYDRTSVDAASELTYQALKEAVGTEGLDKLGNMTQPEWFADPAQAAKERQVARTRSADHHKNNGHEPRRATQPSEAKGTHEVAHTKPEAPAKPSTKKPKVAPVTRRDVTEQLKSKLMPQADINEAYQTVEDITNGKIPAHLKIKRDWSDSGVAHEAKQQAALDAAISHIESRIDKHISASEALEARRNAADHRKAVIADLEAGRADRRKAEAAKRRDQEREGKEAKAQADAAAKAAFKQRIGSGATKAAAQPTHHTTPSAYTSDNTRGNMSYADWLKAGGQQGAATRTTSNAPTPELKTPPAPETHESKHPQELLPIVDVFHGSVKSEDPEHTENQDHYHVNMLTGNFVVADGMGGYKGGETASAAVTDALAAMPQAETVEQAKANAVAAMQQARDAMADMAKNDSDLRKMATTALSVQRVGNQLVIANIGDSPIGRLRDGKWELLVREQGFANATNGIGPRTSDSSIEHYLETVVTDIQPGDRYAMMSDGITGDWEKGMFPEDSEYTDRVTDDEFQAALAPEYSAEQATINLVKASKKTDDKTVVIFDIGGQPELAAPTNEDDPFAGKTIDDLINDKYDLAGERDRLEAEASGLERNSDDWWAAHDEIDKIDNQLKAINKRLQDMGTDDEPATIAPRPFEANRGPNDELVRIRQAIKELDKHDPRYLEKFQMLAGQEARAMTDSLRANGGSVFIRPRDGGDSVVETGAHNPFGTREAPVAPMPIVDTTPEAMRNRRERIMDAANKAYMDATSRLGEAIDVLTRRKIVKPALGMLGVAAAVGIAYKLQSDDVINFNPRNGKSIHFGPLGQSADLVPDTTPPATVPVEQAPVLPDIPPVSVKKNSGFLDTLQSAGLTPDQANKALREMVDKGVLDGSQIPVKRNPANGEITQYMPKGGMMDLNKPGIREIIENAKK